MARDPQAAAIGARLRAEAAQAVTALTLEITANLTVACPVDTGHARANFVPGTGPALTGEADTGAAQQTGIARMLGYTLVDGDVHITNNVPYLERLIMGSSSQAPAGWDLAAIDAGVATIQSQYANLQIDLTVGGAVSVRGGSAAGNMASAYSPFGGDE